MENKLIHGIGYHGQGIYKSKINGKITKVYQTWKNMMDRCYYENSINNHPTYKNCTVSSKWYCLQSFGKWFEENYNSETMKGWHLDKDILLKNNKVYGPDTCCFVPMEINNLFTKSNIKRGRFTYRFKI